MTVHTRVAYNGMNLTIWEWSKQLGIPLKTLEMRYRRGKTGKALFAPPRMYTYRKEYVG
jgi:hypothetical protein